MNTTDAIYSRRAVRHFADEPVSEVDVRKLIDAAIQAPNAINTQPWAFVVVQDKELLKELSDHTMELMKDQSFPPDLEAMFRQPDWNIFYNAGTLIVVCAKTEGLHADWDCCFAAENLMIEARNMGLGTCPIGFAWTVLAVPEVKALLGIPDGYQAIVPIIVGHVTSFPPSPGRREPEILSWKKASLV